MPRFGKYFTHQFRKIRRTVSQHKIHMIDSLPDKVQVDFVEPYDAVGPFGAKGVGELATFGVSPAIANAIDDAVGVRLTELPLTAETVFRALRANNNEPLEDE